MTNEPLTDEATDGEEADEIPIQRRIDRVEEIADRLEAGEVDLAEATELRTEAKRHLLALEQQLDVGDGAVIEFDER